MDSSIKISVPPAEIIPHLKKVYDFLGYRGQPIDEEVAKIVNSLIEECREHLSSEFGYRIVNGRVISKDAIEVEGVIFRPGAIIAHALHECNKFALLVATVGDKFDKWLNDKKNSGDVMEMYVSDALGSVIAEATTSIGALYIASQARKNDEKITNSYSPGYCSWDVSQQQKLFSLLPPSFCDITLSTSSLMRPIKSTSSIIGIGINAIKRPYGCSICKKTDCFLKLARSKNHIELP